MDDRDRFRFVHDLFEFNDEAPAVNNNYYNFRRPNNDFVISTDQQNRASRKLLVEVLSFCLMPNHYHLLLSPLVENGLSLFMKKLNIGYAKFFNQRYERVGTLFEGRFKSVLVGSQAHFIYLPYYIHLNPLDLAAPEWRERKINDFKKAINFLDSYRWSSHLDYKGEKNFPSVTQRDLLLEIFGGKEGYNKKFRNWLKELNLNRLKDYTLE